MNVLKLTYNFLFYGNYSYKLLKLEFIDLNARLIKREYRIKANHQNSLLISYINLNNVGILYSRWLGLDRKPQSAKNFFERYIEIKLYGDLTTNFPSSTFIAASPINSYSLVI